VILNNSPNALRDLAGPHRYTLPQHAANIGSCLIEHRVMFDMEVIVRRQDHPRCASITSMIRHYVARRAQVIEDHPHNAADSVVRSLFQERAADLPAALGRSALQDGPGPGLRHSAL
jgi:hypothetical protein